MNNDVTIGEEHVIILRGKDAEEFEKYDSEPLSAEEIESFKEAKRVYRKYHKPTAT
jgi:hypothetical protein